MLAEIKSIWSPEIKDLDSFITSEPENFNIHLQAYVGLENSNIKESFEFEVCTPQWLLSNYSKNEVIFVKNLIIVDKYNYELIYEKIERSIRDCSGKSWDEIAEKISRIGQWEFEDYDLNLKSSTENMQAQLIKIEGYEIENLENFEPKDPENFYISIKVSIGIRDKKFSENFEFIVCTPQWLLSNIEKNEIIFLRHTILVFQYDFKQIYSRLRGS